MARNFRVQVSDDLARWVNGLDDFRLDATAAAEWRQVNEVFFERTQRYVHVLSGDLKRSGTLEVEVDGQRIIGTTTYGGVMGSQGEVDYADEEIARGGSHDFYTRAYSGMTNTFKEGVQAVLASQFARALRR